METSIISRIGHALSYGGTTAIIGMFIVFLGLSILIGFVTLMAKIFKTVNFELQLPRNRHKGTYADRIGCFA